MLIFSSPCSTLGWKILHCNSTVDGSSLVFALTGLKYPHKCSPNNIYISRPKLYASRKLKAVVKYQCAIHIQAVMCCVCHWHNVTVVIPVVHSKVSFLDLVNGGVQHDGHHSCYCCKHCPHMRHRHPCSRSPVSRQRIVNTQVFIQHNVIKSTITPSP